jgi:hypothetical protein
MLLFNAVRTDEKVILATAPLQSDYVMAWKSTVAQAAGSRAENGRSLYRRIRKILAATMWGQAFRRRRLGRKQRQEFSFSNKRFFRKVKEPYG